MRANSPLSIDSDFQGGSPIRIYDAAGNITQINRGTANGSLSILSFNPTSAPAGATVTIVGSGFSTTPASNTVKFNGVTATVTASTANTLTVTVPATATSGPHFDRRRRKQRHLLHQLSRPLPYPRSPPINPVPYLARWPEPA